MRIRNLIVTGFFFALLAWAQAPDVASLAHSVDEHYNHLKTFKAGFVEVYSGPGAIRRESGVLWLKKPGKMRWDYQQPTQKVFLADSKNAYFYVTGEDRATKVPLKNLDDLRSPLRYLLGKAKLQKELKDLSLAPDINPLVPGDVVLRGIPKDMEDRVSEVLLEVTPGHELRRILIREVDGTTTEFQFSSIQENLPVQDSLFRFIPPPGVEVVDQSQLTQ